MSANTSKLSIKYHRIGLFGFSHNQEIIASVFPNIKFDFFSKLNGLLQSQNNLNEYDYLILRLSGENPQNLMSNLKLSLFERIESKIVLWTQDNHHQPITPELYNYFFKIYAAHSEFYDSELFPNISHLPCCFAAENINKVYQFNNFNFENKFDISSSFMLYQGYDRNSVFFRIAKILQRNKRNYAFGRTSNMNGQISNYLQLMFESRVILNLTLKGELNMRFFESQVSNRTILMDEVRGIESLNLDLRNTFLFKRDLSNFEEQFERAINHKPVSVYENYLLNHTSVNRISKIVQELTGLIPANLNITLRRDEQIKILPLKIRKYSNLILYFSALPIQNRFIKSVISVIVKIFS
jgi:hypothetical protein